MSPIAFGLVAGVGFGLLDVLLMLPLKLPDKRRALLGAFCSRFAIGFLIPLCKLPLPPVAAGAVVSLLISLPDALITKSYVPILAGGLVGGLLIGWLSGHFVV